ncbi:MAG: hypothetical protein ACLTLQ_03205 [[Clostridium] scindens]
MADKYRICGCIWENVTVISMLECGRHEKMIEESPCAFISPVMQGAAAGRRWQHALPRQWGS